MAKLGNLAPPDVSAMRGPQKTDLLLGYMAQLNRQLRYVLENLGEDNLGKDMREAVAGAKKAAGDVAHAVRDKDFRSYVRQTARELEARVQKDRVIASINLSPEAGVKILADHISLEGLVTVNAYFRVTKDGRVEAVGGKIGGWTLDADSLFKGLNTADSAPGAFMGTKGTKKAVAIAGSAERKDWFLLCGNKFGVTQDGTVYAGDGVFRGRVPAGQIEGGAGGSLDGGLITPGSVGENQMEAAYAAMKALLAGAEWKTMTVNGETAACLVRGGQAAASEGNG